MEPQGTVKKAVEALVKAGQTLVDILIWFVISWLPFLALFGAIIYFVIRMLKKGKAKRQAKKRKAWSRSRKASLKPDTNPKDKDKRSRNGALFVSFQGVDKFI